ncbi:Hypothetical predicted protein [Mytilus galloprovincialis]|uniref:Uncharacterized protein n=1 Tax=Mytilus galloprovincialis TaxID=29158 RepID=A0A8B6GCK7_MYTGA|nr:Hypothetical predicted protein [Mytilus galloprovincialis]
MTFIPSEDCAERMRHIEKVRSQAFNISKKASANMQKNGLAKYPPCEYNIRDEVCVKFIGKDNRVYRGGSSIEAPRAAEVSIPVDKRIIVKIEEYVGEGLVSSSCLRPLLEQFVRHEIFAGEKCANWTNRRFFPSQRDISNFVYAAKLKGLKAKYDQENLMAHVDEWQKDRPEDKFLFSGSDVNTEDTGDSTGFFFLYQSTWQQRLLNLYGNEICLLDVIYRATRDIRRFKRDEMPDYARIQKHNSIHN